MPTRIRSLVEAQMISSIAIKMLLGYLLYMYIYKYFIINREHDVIYSEFVQPEYL